MSLEIENTEKTINTDFQYKEKPAYHLVKRLFDITVSFVSIIILAVPFGITAVLIMLDDGCGKPIFVQDRVGKNGKIFKMYKFRTMCTDAEEKIAELEKFNEMDGPVFKMQNDPRVTRIGKFLRGTNIDELPQLFNILKGDMSFVGPRPALPKEVEQYRPSDRLRLLVTPGLTCYWQSTKSRNQVSFDEWMEMDRKYIMERSVRTDIKLIFKTFSFLLKN